MTKPIAGDWVRTPQGVGLVTLIEEHHLTLPVVYGKPVHVQFNDRSVTFSYENAKRMSFLGYVFNGPRGRWGFGQNHITPVAIAHIFFLIILPAGGVVSELTPAQYIVTVGFGVIVTAAIWYMTWRNYKRKTV